MKLSQTFEQLNSQISYVHYKSSAHLEASFRGDTDFDLLVDPADKSRFEQILLESGFKLTRTANVNSYPDVDDWLAFSVDLQKVIHFHVHYSLVFGYTFVKEYSLPIKKELLGRRIKRKYFGVEIYCIDSRAEIELLALRHIFKFRLRDIPRSFFKKACLPPDFSSELDWLLTEDAGQTVGLLDFSAFFPVESFTVDLNKLNSSWAYVFVSRLRLSVKLREYRRHALPVLHYLKIRNELLKRLSYRRIVKGVPWKRSPQNGGRSIHLVGIDGAGKSTQITALKNTLKKFDVETVYLGFGDGKQSLLRKMLGFFKSRRSSTTSSKLSGESPILNILKRGVFALVLAYERRAKIRRVETYRKKGFFVLVDRYPHLSFGPNDGLILDNKEFGSSLLCFLSRLEMFLSNRLCRYYADSIYYLKTDPEICFRRKPEDSITVLNEKMRLLESTLSDDRRAREINIIDCDRLSIEDITAFIASDIISKSDHD